MAKLRLSAAAKRDLREIRQTGLREHGDAASAVHLDGFERFFAVLGQQPFAGQERLELRRSMESLSHRPHTNLYRVVDDTVIIDRVLHQARDVSRVLRDDQ